MTNKSTNTAALKADRKERKAQALDFSEALTREIAPTPLSSKRTAIADVAAARVAMVLAGSWHDVAKHKAETIETHGFVVNTIAENVAVFVDRQAHARRRNAWDKLASCLRYVSVRQRNDRYGNTHHSVKIVYTDDTAQCVGEGYGYGSHWISTVADVLIASPAGQSLPSGGNPTQEGYGAVSRRVACDNARHDVVEIVRGRDHYVACDRG